MKYHYVYKTTNIINNKIYIGRRVSSVSPEIDPYLGSGKQLLLAIKKYGRENFKKEIIKICDSKEHSAEIEASLVTEEFIKRPDTYNMHKGGFGGFDHINKDSPEDRINLIEYKRKVKSGEIKVGGSSNWTEEGRRKVIQQAKINLKSKNQNPGKIFWETATEEDRNKFSKSISGSNNGSYGTKFYISKDYSGEKLPSMDILIKNRFKLGEQPEGWITLKEWKDSKKKRNGCFGRSWYNDSINNFYLYQDDYKIIEYNLNKGRLNMFKKKGE
jgi:hypothetical protein